MGGLSSLQVSCLACGLPVGSSGYWGGRTGFGANDLEEGSHFGSLQQQCHKVEYSQIWLPPGSISPGWATAAPLLNGRLSKSRR